ncbi:beta-1,3-galactosyltransferase 1 [Misgurnus anguillicaudatus]|uniref:beta-1,3-galactosyltransferase 1 n=1 Tax=Misgurnus anguillicaudatus TaxID=75329 RepID=UPI003CCF66CF
MSYKRWCVVWLLVPGTALLLYLTYNPVGRKWGNQEEPTYPFVRETNNDNKTGVEDSIEGEPDMYHVAYPRKYKFIIDQPHICEEKKPFVVVIVPVPPENIEGRDAIRNTWGGEKPFADKVVLVLFLLGSRSGTGKEALQEQLNNESKHYKDLLQSNFQDSYRNLTIKTMVMMEWLSEKCSQASYAVKVDTDVLLNIRNLINMLANPDTLKSNYMTGLVWYESPVLRDPSNKFYMPYNVFSKDHYPPYPLGMCYIFSTDLPLKFLQQSRQIKPIYIEDAYLGMCLERLGIVPTKPPNMDQFVVIPPKQYNRCYYATLIAVMTESTDQLVTYWTDINLRTAC